MIENADEKGLERDTNSQVNTLSSFLSLFSCFFFFVLFFYLFFLNGVFSSVQSCWFIVLVGYVLFDRKRLNSWCVFKYILIAFIKCVHTVFLLIYRWQVIKSSRFLLFLSPCQVKPKIKCLKIAIGSNSI